MRFFLLHFNCSFAKSPLAAVTILTPTHIAAAGALLAAAKVVLPIPYLDQELSQRIKLGHAHCCFIGLSSLLLSLPPWITTLGLEKSFGLVHHVAKIWTIHISVFEKLWARMRPLVFKKLFKLMGNKLKHISNILFSRFQSVLSLCAFCLLQPSH